MTNILFSIIMPAYNVENYVRFAIESVIKQDCTNWELIIVENGSTDNTTRECEKYLHDNRISLFHSSKGVSRARNYGIKMAKGKYILFLDADDTLNRAALQIYASKLNNCVDLISTRFSARKIYSNKYSLFKGNDKEKYLMQVLTNPTKRCTVTRALFRRKTILKNNIYFDSTLSHGEDSVFFIKYVLIAKEIVDIDVPTYIVKNNPNSAVRHYDKNLSQKYIASIKIIERLLRNRDEPIHEAFDTYVLTQLLIVFVHNIFSDKAALKQQMKNGKAMLDIPLFENAAKSIKTKNASGMQKIVFYFIKRKNMFMLALISKIRILQNSRKK